MFEKNKYIGTDNKSAKLIEKKDGKDCYVLNISSTGLLLWSKTMKDFLPPCGLDYDPA